MTRRLIVSATLAVAATMTQPAARQIATAVDPEPPIVAVRYRGTPVLDELALLRALGFTAIVWTEDRARPTDIDRMAGTVGLRIVAPPAAGARPGTSLTIDLARDDAGTLPARAWLAIGDGARLIAIDAGAPTGAGVRTAAGDTAPWVGAAVSLARQVDVNGELLARLRTGPPLAVRSEPPSPVRVELRDAGRAWVLIAANPSAMAAAVAVDLPRSVPFGPWVSLIDGHDMSMAVRPAAHEYRASLAAGEARVYVIDKPVGLESRLEG